MESGAAQPKHRPEQPALPLVAAMGIEEVEIVRGAYLFDCYFVRREARIEEGAVDALTQVEISLVAAPFEQRCITIPRSRKGILSSLYDILADVVAARADAGADHRHDIGGV
jgi:hypothetical protein